MVKSLEEIALLDQTDKELKQRIYLDQNHLREVQKNRDAALLSRRPKSFVPLLCQLKIPQAVVVAAAWRSDCGKQAEAAVLSHFGISRSWEYMPEGWDFSASVDSRILNIRLPKAYKLTSPYHLYTWTDEEREAILAVLNDKGVGVVGPGWRGENWLSFKFAGKACEELKRIQSNYRMDSPAHLDKLVIKPEGWY